MKVCVVTIVDNINYGTYLQALALCKAVEKFDYSVVLLNYCRINQSRKILIRKRLTENKSFKNKMFVYVLQGIITPIRKKSFLTEINKYVHLTKKYIGFESVAKKVPNADIFLLGSDQVWNTNYNDGVDKTFYLDFVKNKKRVAYAASIGMDELDPRYAKDIVSLLGNFEYITLRENNSIELIEKIGFQNISSVLDPTFLLSDNEWCSLFKLKKRANDYVLLYSVEADKTRFLIDLAKKIFPYKRIILVTNGNPLKNRYPDLTKVYYSPSIRLFLELIYNSFFVFASSFHGTAFSINFNKQFLVVSPNKYNVRIESLLDSFGLNNRMIYVDDENDIENVSIKNLIDYNTINQKLDYLKNMSLNKLKDMITN